MKKETLEEVAERYSKKSSASVFQENHKKDFMAGAKWQMERSYSEEDMIEFAYNYIDERRDQGARAMTPELLIKQLKNK